MKTRFITGKSFIIFLTLILLMCICTISAYATTYSANSSGKSFKEPWSVTKINTSERTFKYGFNKAYINEDYTHTYHRTKNHSAYVKNTGSAYEKKANKGNYAKAEIKHHSGTVYYEYNY